MAIPFAFIFIAEISEIFKKGLMDPIYNNNNNNNNNNKIIVFLQNFVKCEWWVRCT
jgi:hypothetical protein